MVKLQMDKTVQHDVVKHQFKVYLPIKIVQAMKWKRGDNLELLIHGKDMLLLKKTGKQSPPDKNYLY